jgi:hypothetical protein
MVLPSSGSIVHAELDDIETDQRHENFVCTSEQLRSVIERLTA